ncbi:MAG TPA: ABC transporter permease [Streptosporangiaceae bacterium]|nr:ABC transporter permease [Streptosporangiaceae bacterium]
MQTVVFAGRTVRHTLRTPAILISSVVIPLLLLFTMLIMLGGVVGRTGGHYTYIARLAPLVMLSTATMAAAISSADFYRGLHEGMFARLRTMPVHLGSALAGRIAGDMLRGLLATVVATAAALPLGFRFTQGLPAALGYYGLLELFAFMMAWVAVLVALLCSTTAGPQNVLNAPLMLLFFLSSGFVPLTDFPAIIQPIVRANPLSTADNALIALSAGGPATSAVLQTLAWALGVSVVCALTACRRFARLAIASH